MEKRSMGEGIQLNKWSNSKLARDQTLNSSKIKS